MKIPHSPSGTEPKSSMHSRFIPREELSHFEAWSPGALSASADTPPRPGNGGASRAAPGPADPLHAARQAGYQDGYRDGLAALEGFKKSVTNSAAAQLSTLLASVNAQLDALQQAMADTLVDTATQLARQIVRGELGVRPQVIAEVATQALDALMLSARHITLRLHPDDQPLVAQGAADVLAARGARLIADASVQRGGCIIESDLGRVDASIEARWRRAVASIGSERTWDMGTEPAGTDPAAAPADSAAPVAAAEPDSNAAPAPHAETAAPAPHPEAAAPDAAPAPDPGADPANPGANPP
jgi:flagellar assembly protein FliH